MNKLQMETYPKTLLLSVMKENITLAHINCFF